MEGVGRRHVLGGVLAIVLAKPERPTKPPRGKKTRGLAPSTTLAPSMSLAPRG